MKTLRTERTRAGTVVNLGRSGFRHELVLHSSTEEMLEFVVPFAEEGVAAGEPTMLLVRREVAMVLEREQHPHARSTPSSSPPRRR